MILGFSKLSKNYKIFALLKKMSNEESPQFTRRATRLSAANYENAVESSKTCNLKPLTINELLYGNQSMSLDELMSLLGLKPMFPFFVHGGFSTWKISIVLNILDTF